jgi:hypothetical protein
MQAHWVDYYAIMDLASQMMDGHITYHLGGKAAFKTNPANIHAIDCSGFVRYFMYHATNGSLIMPDGSWIQNDWCKKQQYERVEYATAAYSDGWLRIAFIQPQKGHPGHVWLILNGKTLESHGGKGPDRRSWDTHVLKAGVHDCYKLAQTYVVYDAPLPSQAGETTYA